MYVLPPTLREWAIREKTRYARPCYTCSTGAIGTICGRLRHAFVYAHRRQAIHDQPGRKGQRMRTMQSLAPAKINVYLRIVGRRPDGYHLLDSLMVPISLYDEIHIAVALGEQRATRPGAALVVQL